VLHRRSLPRFRNSMKMASPRLSWILVLFVCLAHLSSGVAFRPRATLRSGQSADKPAVNNMPAVNATVNPTVEPAVKPMPEFLDLKSSKLAVRRGVIYLVPPLFTFAAFYYFRQTAHLFHSTIHWLATVTDTVMPKTAVEIDLQTQVVTQVVNGPVITSISLLFAALVSTTVSTLHSRQMEMYNSFSKQMHEANQLRSLTQHLWPSQSEILRPLVQTLIRGIFQESFSESESSDIGTLIDTLVFQVQTWMTDTLQSSSIVLQAHDTLMTIAEARRSHFSILKKHFPFMHYCTLAFLALAICASFLIATDQALYVLESIPVRLLWSILVGSFTSLAVVCYDLAAPFAGVYHVATTHYKIANAKDDSLLFG
jgi:hypothetical protein